MPPTAPNAAISPTFDISPSYVASLDAEFSRVYEEYNRRLNTVQTVCQEMIQLWAELGTPQAQTDTSIVKYYRDSPEQLGLHNSDIAELKAKKERLIEEKRGRERRLGQLRSTIEDLWDRLNVDMQERKQFLSSNRGCGLRTINEFEDELSRLNELKRQNLHIFVEEARVKLQELWDALYFSEEEMLDFTPAFSDVCTDALLSSHEAEINRLEVLKEQRLPILQKIDRHRELIKERDDLAQSSQDASRLMARGQKGERRDPGKLLREEKMRKRIAKELPKIESELKQTLERWEDEYGRPFLVLGDRYLDELYACAARAPPPRSKTPSAAPMPPKQHSKSGSVSRAGSIRQPPPSRVKTPAPNFSQSVMGRNPLSMSVSAASGGPKSPSKIPARAPLKTMPHGGNSPERKTIRPSSHDDLRASTMRKMPPPMAPPMAPPPRMKDLFVPPDPVSTPINRYDFSNRSDRSDSIVRHVPPEDPYDDRSFMSQTMRPTYTSAYNPPRVESRQISGTSSIGTGTTMQSGSENWETFSEQSDEPPEHDVDFYKYRQQMARTKRFTPEGGHSSSPRGVQGKKLRGIRTVDGENWVDEGGQIMRTVEGSDCGWTDDGDAY